MGESPRITSNLKINNFLDETYKRPLRLSDYFSDTDKFIRSVNILKRVVDYDLLDEKKTIKIKKVHNYTTQVNEVQNLMNMHMVDSSSLFLLILLSPHLSI